jgi:hypothetical protein
MLSRFAKWRNRAFRDIRFDGQSHMSPTLGAKFKGRTAAQSTGCSWPYCVHSAANIYWQQSPVLSFGSVRG